MPQKVFFNKSIFTLPTKTLEFAKLNRASALISTTAVYLLIIYVLCRLSKYNLSCFPLETQLRDLQLSFSFWAGAIFKAAFLGTTRSARLAKQIPQHYTVNHSLATAKTRQLFTSVSCADPVRLGS